MQDLLSAISFQRLVSDFATFFVVIDPIGVLPLFIGLTRHMNEEKRRAIAFKSVLVASVVLVTFAFLGQILFDLLEVKLSSFKIAGGIILFLFGVKMIFSEEIQEKASLTSEAGHDIAVFPLALPSLAGPGAMLAVVVRIAGGESGVLHQSLQVVTLLSVLGVTLLMFLSARAILKVIGQTGGSVIVRVLGIILAAIAAESVLTGVSELSLFAGTKKSQHVEQHVPSKEIKLSKNFYDISVKDMKDKDVPLSTYKGKVLLIVNTASKCGFTPQYEGLENFYKKYKAKGLEVLGFPCNQFGGQEPGSAEEIKSFCELKYHVTFPMFAKIDVNGDNASELYKFLKSEKAGILGTEAIKWNFTKFLIDKNGVPVKRYASQTKPEDIVDEIEKLL